MTTMANRWDNIEILRAIDHHQEHAGGAPNYAINGLKLMEGISGKDETDEWRIRGFVQEIHIARNAGLLAFDLMTHGGAAPPNPDSSPHYYLQTISNFALTVAGQDRARGRQVAQRTPDPTEDDGRPISILILSQVAAEISEEYGMDQIPVFLREAGIPPESLILPVEIERHDIASILAWLDQCGSEGRRALRSFIGRWLDDRLLSGPGVDSRAKLIEQLARQGWLVREGNLVIGEPIVSSRSSLPVVREIRVGALHSRIADIATPYIRSGHYAPAVFEAMKAVNNRVKDMVGSADDGKRLMGMVFSLKAPRISLGDLSTDTGRNIQEGYGLLFMGAVQAFRNPGAHEQFEKMDDNEALEQLAFASLLMRRLDDAFVDARRDGVVQ
jgi:uncharacterized protein (TIGR02391 family)